VIENRQQDGHQDTGAVNDGAVAADLQAASALQGSAPPVDSGERIVDRLADPVDRP
jgi:hypothetical protein